MAEITISDVMKACAQGIAEEVRSLHYDTANARRHSEAKRLHRFTRTSTRSSIWRGIVFAGLSALCSLVP